MTDDLYRIACYRDLRRFLTPPVGRALEVSGSALITEFGWPTTQVETTRYPEFDLCDSAHTLSRGDRYDLVFADQVLEHVHNPFYAVHGLYNLLRPRGRAAVATVGMFPVHDLPADYWRFTPDGLRLLFDPPYWEDVHVAGWGCRDALDLVADWPTNNRDPDFRPLAEVNETDVPIVVWATARRR